MTEQLFKVVFTGEGVVQPGPGQTTADLPPDHPDHTERPESADEKETDR